MRCDVTMQDVSIMLSDDSQSSVGFSKSLNCCQTDFITSDPP